MLKNFNKKFLLKIIAGGIFYGLSFPPLNFHWLIFPAFVIIIDIALNCNSVKQIFFRIYFIFFTAGIVAVSWIFLSGMRENADRFLIAGGIFVNIVYPLFFVAPFILFYFINKNFKGRNFNLSLLSFPFLWTGFEYLQTFGQINFPWLFAANTQTYNLNKIQYAEFTGMFGVSFWICIISVLLYILFSKIKNNSSSRFSPKSVSLLLLIIAVYFLPDGLNFFIKRNFTEVKKIKVGIVQPDINPWKKWGGKQMELMNIYTEMIKEIYSSNPDVKLIILPETALPYYYREKPFEERFAILKNLCDSISVPLLIGTPDLKVYKNQDDAPDDAKIMRSTGIKYDTYNSAVLFEPSKDKDNFQSHDKIKLVIGSERVPYQEILPFTKSLVKWGVGLGNWQMGKDTNIISLPGGEKFNAAICYESVYPEFFADFVDKGADFSVIITNDGWWGKFFGTYQHNRFAVYRAIENRRWIARCANTGISDFIGPDGNFYDETKIEERINIVREVGVIKEKTFFTENKDLFSKICIFFSLLFLITSFFFKNKETNSFR